MRILINAYAVSPLYGSEPGTGWNYVSRISRNHDVTLLTCRWDRSEHVAAEINALLDAAREFSRLSIQIIDRPILSKILQVGHSIGFSGPLWYFGYNLWQRRALKVANAMHRNKPFDIVQQLTVTTFRAPGYLWKMEIPFVWGPISGGLDIPYSYFSEFTSRDKIMYFMRNIVNLFDKYILRRFAPAAKRARVVFVSNEDLKRIISRFNSNVILLPETGTIAGDGLVRSLNLSEKLNIIWSGIHVGRKALPLALKIMENLRDRDLSDKVHLSILGAGPMTARCQAMAAHMNIGGMITWHGRLAHSAALDVMRAGHVLMMTSVSDGATTVIMEAIAAGMPVLCHDLTSVLPPQIGVKIPLLDPENSIKYFSDAIEDLIVNRHKVKEMSERCLIAAENLSWDKTSTRIGEVYRDIVNCS